MYKKKKKINTSLRSRGHLSAEKHSYRLMKPVRDLFDNLKNARWTIINQAINSWKADLGEMWDTAWQRWYTARPWKQRVSFKCHRMRAISSHRVSMLDVSCSSRSHDLNWWTLLPETKRTRPPSRDRRSNLFSCCLWKGGVGGVDWPHRDITLRPRQAAPFVMPVEHVAAPLPARATIASHRKA